MKVSMVAIDSITPYPNNPRSNARTVKELKASIERYGFNVPLVLDKVGVVIAGHARLEAAKQLGFEKLPCLVANLSDEDAKRYRLADNRIQDLSRWDDKSLLCELREIGAFDELPGFTEKEKALYRDEFSDVPDMPRVRKAVVEHVEGFVGTDAQEQGDGIPSNVGGSLGTHGQPSCVRWAVTQQQVDAAGEVERRKFVDRGDAYKESMIQVICKGCGKSFSVLRQDISRL